MALATGISDSDETRYDDRRQVGRFLRIGAEQDGVARRKQRVHVVMPGHDVERMLGDDTRRNLQHEAAGLLADGDEVRFERVQDALTRRCVRDELAAAQRRAERATLRRVFAFRLEKERVLAPGIDAALGAEGLVDLGDFSRWRDRVTDDATANLAHDVSDSTVAMDNAGNAWILDLFGFHGDFRKRHGKHNRATAGSPINSEPGNGKNRARRTGGRSGSAGWHWCHLATNFRP